MLLCKRVRKRLKGKKFTFARLAKFLGRGASGEGRKRWGELESRNHEIG
jgi:hypothetical protein